MKPAVPSGVRAELVSAQSGNSLQGPGFQRGCSPHMSLYSVSELQHLIKDYLRKQCSQDNSKVRNISPKHNHITYMTKILNDKRNWKV
jgi:hypothetical protein